MCFPLFYLCHSILNQHGFRANLEGSMIPGKTLMIGLALWCCPWHGAGSRVFTCWWLWPHGGQTVCNSNFKSKMETYHISYTPFWVNGFHIICPFLSQWLSYWNFELSRWIHRDILFFFANVSPFFLKEVLVTMEWPKLAPESLIWTFGRPFFSTTRLLIPWEMWLLKALEAALQPTSEESHDLTI